MTTRVANLNVGSKLDEDLLFEQYNASSSLSSSREDALKPLVPSDHKVTNSHKLAHIKRLVTKAWCSHKFLSHNPSPQPLSLDREHLQTLSKMKYVVAEKTDGVFMSLLLGMWPQDIHGGAPFAVMINRNYDVYEVRIAADSLYFENTTLLIGELVWESKDGGPGCHKIFRHLYSVFDVVMLAGKSYCVPEQGMTFIDRIRVLDSIIASEAFDILNDPMAWLGTVQTLADRGMIVCEFSKNALTLRTKRFVPLSQLNLLVKTIIPALNHSNDGIVFVPIHDVVAGGTLPYSYKWKRPEQQTIDLEVDFARDDETRKWSSVVYCRHRGDRLNATKHGLMVPRSASAPKSIKAKRKSHPGVVDDGSGVVYKPAVLDATQMIVSLCGYHAMRGKESFSCIIECKLDATQDVVICRPVKVRTDKATANDAITILSTLKSLERAVTIEELVDLASKIQQ